MTQRVPSARQFKLTAHVEKSVSRRSSAEQLSLLLCPPFFDPESFGDLCPVTGEIAELMNSENHRLEFSFKYGSLNLGDDLRPVSTGRHMRRRYEDISLAGFAVAALGVGFWGYALAGSGYVTNGGWHPAYPLTGMESMRCLVSAIGLVRFPTLFQAAKDPWQLVVAQFAVPAAAMLLALQMVRLGWRTEELSAKARSKSGHTVVCGLGDVGMQVIHNLASSGKRVVAVERSGDSPNVATCEKYGIPIVKGDAKDAQVLQAAGIRQARAAVVTTGMDGENMEIALQIKAIYSKQGLFDSSKIQVLAETRNGRMLERLMGREKGAPAANGFELRVFNPYVNAARMLVRRLQVPPIPEFEALTFVVAGFGAYGREIVRHLVRCSPVGLNRSLKIIVFDREADEAKAEFAITDPAAGKAASIEFVKASLAQYSADWKKAVEKKLDSAGALLGVAVALGDDETTLHAALDLRSTLDRKKHLQTPVFVRLEHHRQLGELVRKAESLGGLGDRVQIFGSLEETLSLGVLFDCELDALARALHEDYLRQPEDRLDPRANVPWEELPEPLKNASRRRSDNIPLLMDLAGIRLFRAGQSPAATPLDDAQIELLAQLEHRRYTAERKLAVHGAPTGADIPNPEDWNGLTEEQRGAKKREAARLPNVMASLGMELVPVRTMRMYGESLAGVGSGLEPLIAAPPPVHYNAIVDLDEAEAVRVANRALELPSISLWLFSRETPREFFDGEAQDNQSGRSALIQRASGWAPRDRLALEASSEASMTVSAVA